MSINVYTMKTKYLCIFLPMFLYVGTSLAQASDSSSQQPVTASTSNLSDEIENKKISDIDQRLNAVKNTRIEDVAQAIAEVDEWFYAQKDWEQARGKIDNEIEMLRSRIETEVATLSKAALEAPDGRIASEKMSKINVLLSLYPAPKTDEKRTRLEQITSNILNTSRRVEDIRRLRYNSWAIGQIQGSLKYYRYQVKTYVPNLEVWGARNITDIQQIVEHNRKKIQDSLLDKNALSKACINWMGSINPAFLEPAVMDLYNYVYGLTRDALLGGDDNYLIVFTQGFANPNTIRKTPSDF